MADRFEIQDGMEVVGSDGARVGVVGDVETGRILVRDAADGRADHHLALSHVERVADGRVHLNDSARVALGGFSARVAEAVGDPEATEPHEPVPPTLNRAVPGAKPRGNFYLPWILGVVGLLLLFGLYRGCVAEQERDLVSAPAQIEPGPVGAVDAGAAQPVQLPNGRQVQLAAGSLAFDLRNYLADPAPGPRSFRFERVHFDTGSAQVRPAEEAGIAAVGQVLQAYPNARVRVVGYTDARGSTPANANLGRERADAVAGVLSGNGVSRDRIEAVSGGEGGPAGANATAGGQAENRRTELVVTAK